MIKLISVVTIFSFLSACSALENYEFGDGTRSLVQLKRDYCAESKGLARAAILRAIRKIEPDYSSVCK